ncbi:coiled-coil domain-containing protein 77 isoform X1 [Octopus bimaculoides]|nr:coiled-coil domain-containing protein 77 isoform X1 [Octopus bimaculoides]XP_052834213.1 coiled-coil domain-containing protein 77 isoform X1 [Octopus bimaculoides]XP_052834214.1 coiled-coil domain-containing protein 77 isoform X1 [Octopus bimaculoides]XP_052834215.1 coiled-coil domain-containing protein 77 isoform X1 [Octopus bimaculoides]
MLQNPLVYLNKSSNALVVDDDDDDWEKENYGSGLGDKQDPDCQDKLGHLDNGATDIIDHHPDHRHYHPGDDGEGDGVDYNDNVDDADEDNDIVCMRRELDLLLGRTGPSKKVTVHTLPSRQHRRFLADLDGNIHGQLTRAADSRQMTVPQKAMTKEGKGTKTSKLREDVKDKETKKSKRGGLSAEERKKGERAVKTNMVTIRKKNVDPAVASGDEDVIERGASREVTKSSRQPNNKASAATPPSHPLPSIDERLSQLRPSRELLEFYRKKIAEYNEEHTSIMGHLDTYKETYEEMLRELEDKQKIQHLLSLGGYPEGEVTYFHKEPPAMAIIEQKYSKNVDSSQAAKSENQGVKKKKSCETKCLCESLRQDNKILSMQIERLQSQLEEQTKNSKEHIASLFADRYEKQMEEDARRKRDERKIEVLLEKLQKTQELLYDTTKQFLQQRYTQRTNEREWMAEKDELLQHLDKLQEWSKHHCHHTTATQRKTAMATSSIAPATKDITDGHHHCCNKHGACNSCTRRAATATHHVGVDVCGIGMQFTENKDQELLEEIQNLRFELQQVKTMSDMYRSQAIEGEEELCKIREEGDFAKESFKDRSQKMSKRLQLMNSRYQELERRRHFEVEGFKNDIKNLRTRLKEVERELYKVTLGLSEELDEKDPDNLDMRILRNVHLSTGRSQKIMRELKRLKSKVYSLENDLRHL